jgi:hypothetical protein
MVGARQGWVHDGLQALGVAKCGDRLAKALASGIARGQAGAAGLGYSKKGASGNGWIHPQKRWEIPQS